MDKDLIILQKEIGLHVHDIERIQGLISRLAVKKGETQDELRRNKEKSRKTQAFLSETKKVQGSSTKNAGETSGTSPEKSMQKTMMSGGNMTSTSGMSNSQRSLIVELLLFGPQALAKRGVNMTTSSFA